MAVTDCHSKNMVSRAFGLNLDNDVVTIKNTHMHTVDLFP